MICRLSSIARHSATPFSFWKRMFSCRLLVRLHQLHWGGLVLRLVWDTLRLDIAHDTPNIWYLECKTNHMWFNNDGHTTYPSTQWALEAPGFRQPQRSSQATTKSRNYGHTFLWGESGFLGYVWENRSVREKKYKGGYEGDKQFTYGYS